MWDIIGLFLLVLIIGVVTLAGQWIARRPADVFETDPQGLRTIVMFEGDDPSFFTGDDPDDLLVGTRLFSRLCKALRNDGIDVAPPDRVDNAQSAVCTLDGEVFTLVLEWLDPNWALSVEWTPTTAQERRHQRWAKAVYAPKDSPELRRLLDAVGRIMEDDPLLSNAAWHRREDWAEESWEDGRPSPFEEMSSEDRSLPPGDGL